MSASVVDTIKSVNGVNSCKIINENGEIAQVFVEAKLLADNDEARTQEIKGVVRSIIGAVAIHHNLNIDYRKIKVIDYKPENHVDSTGNISQRNARIQFVAAYSRRAPRLECVVELHCLGKNYIGTAIVEEDLGISTFKAFSNAFDQMGYGLVKLCFLQVLNNALAQEKVALIKIEYSDNDGYSSSLLGVAEVDEDLPSAVVKATLNALNRKVVILSS